MNFVEFVRQMVDFPVIETENVVEGFSSRNALEVQLTRWVQQGKLVQLRRGLYVLSEPYRKVDPFEFFLASVIERPSYISLEKALEYHNLIPEGVSTYTSITTKRPGRYATKLGTFDYRHIQVSLFWGYEAVAVHHETAFVALPEKALLDLFYAKPVRPSLDYLEGLRLQNMDKINKGRLLAFARRFKKPKILQAARTIQKYAAASHHAEKVL